MRLEQLQERLVQTDTEKQKYRGQFKGHGDDPDVDDIVAARNKHDPNFLGSGYYSAVRQDKHDPHMVKKSHHSPLHPNHRNPDKKYDGFDIYVNYLIKHKLMDNNIHFPKVYRAKTIKDALNNRISKYQIEKLIPISELSNKELEAFIEQNFDHTSDILTYLKDGERSYAMSWALGRIRNSISGEADGHFKDEKLKEACDIIQKLSYMYDMRVDLHSGNLMFRRTPYGPQLVFADPFSMVNPKSRGVEELENEEKSK